MRESKRHRRDRNRREQLRGSEALRLLLGSRQIGRRGHSTAHGRPPTPISTRRAKNIEGAAVAARRSLGAAWHDRLQDSSAQLFQLAPSQSEGACLNGQRPDGARYQLSAEISVDSLPAQPR